MSPFNVIADHSTAVLAVCIPGLIATVGYLFWKTMNGGGDTQNQAPMAPPGRITPRRPMAPTPGIKPKSLEAGMAEHQVRGEAKTVKVSLPAGTPGAPPVRDERKVDTARLPVASNEDDDAKDSLFAGLGEKPEGTTIIRQAERMEELGFHNQVAKTAVSTESDNRKTEILTPATSSSPSAPTAPTFRIPGQAPKPDPKRAETRSGDEAPAAPLPAAANNRTQTQELDDILSRIDRVLAENPVMATTTLGSASGESTSGPKPVPARPEDNRVDLKKPDAKTDDPTGQQKLF